MVFLFIQTWIWLIAAALLGLLVGWALWRPEKSSDELKKVQRQLEECRRRCAELESIELESIELEKINSPQAAGTPAPVEADEYTSELVSESGLSDSWRPTPLPEPDGKPDDLKEISGIGPIIERTLNSLGVYHFRQIESLTAENIKWINNYLGFFGRIEREGWIEQAHRLDRNGSTAGDTDLNDNEDDALL